jgi:serine protease AprX
VAGIIANSQVGSDGEWDGVAPGVMLVGVRVLDEDGYGTYERVIQGIQWVINHKASLHIRVMNLSLVSPAQSAYWADPLNQAAMAAWQAGIIVVAAAGNGGPNPMTVGVPGNNPYIITAGAFTDNYTPYEWDDDYIADFSAAGPTLDGFVKPDLVAPGAHMVSTMLPSAELAQNHQVNQVTPHYFSMAGTSQAAAVVSGIAALVVNAHPQLTPDEVKYRLMVTAFPWVDPVTTDAGYSIWQQGAGRVNAPDAVTADIQGQANFGMDIAADLAGLTHYEGFSYFDETSGLFKLRSDFENWSGGYFTWNGGYGTWSGGYGTWSGGYGTWSGGYGTWSGGYGTWSGGYGTWSGGYGTWSGGYGTWSGGYGTWSGGYGTWSGTEPWAGTIFSDPAFVAGFLAGASPDASSSTTSVNYWVDEP